MTTTLALAPVHEDLSRGDMMTILPPRNHVHLIFVILLSIVF